MLYISHRLEEVETLADRITVLRDGKMIGTWPASELDQRQMAELMVGRELSMLYPPETRRSQGGTGSERRRPVGRPRQGCRLLFGPPRRGARHCRDDRSGPNRVDRRADGLAPGTGKSDHGQRQKYPEIRCANHDAGGACLSDRGPERGRACCSMRGLGPNLTLQALDMVSRGLRLNRKKEALTVKSAVTEYDIRDPHIVDQGRAAFRGESAKAATGQGHAVRSFNRHHRRANPRHRHWQQEPYLPLH